MSEYQPKHIYTVFIFFSAEPGPHKYSGGLQFDYKPIHVCYETSIDEARETAIRLNLRIRPHIEPYVGGCTENRAEEIVQRLKSLIGIEDQNVALSEYFKVAKPVPKYRPMSEEHKKKISKSLRGRKYPKSHREKISKALSGRRKPTMRGNTHRANRSWVVTSPVGREHFTSNLTGFCREHNLSVSNLWSVANLERRHWKWWKCRRCA